MGNIATICTFICIVICVFQTYTTKKDKRKGIIGNQAQNVISVGVLFTFFGIAISLMNFNTDPKAMEDSIGIFLDGMKTAFYTSIIGMVFGLIIKWIQSDVEVQDDRQYKESLDDIKAMTREINKNSTTTEEGFQGVVNALQGLKASIEASSSESMAREMNQLTTALLQFTEESKASQDDMKKIATGMESQVEKLENLSNVLSANITKMGSDISTNITKMSSDIGSNIAQMADSMKESIASMDSNLGQKLEAMKSEQSALLSNMSAGIDSMQKNSEQSANDSREMLADSKAYQNQSLENEAKQNEILAANTQGIVEMGKSFDDFVNNVQKVFGDAVIGALNNSMQRLNDQLEKQFGENFVELNKAVKALNTWQQDYQQTIEKTTTNLQQLETTFNGFYTTISEDITRQVEALDVGINKFTETSNKNIEVQNKLNESTSALNDMVQTAKDNVEAVEKVFNGFAGFTEEVIKDTNSALTKHKDVIVDNIITVSESINELSKQNNKTVSEAVKNFASEADKLKDVAFEISSDTGEYMKQFGETTKSVMQEVGKTLDAFKSDFKNNTDAAIGNMEALFEQLAKNTDKQHGKSIETLTAALAGISRQMVDNYKSLLAKIAEVDSLLVRNGGSR